MPTTLDDQLVVALSARALFDFEEENRVFEAQDDVATCVYNLIGWISQQSRA